MAVHLRSLMLGKTCSLLLQDDHLLKLDHDRTRDRMRRYHYRTIEQVIIWQVYPWWGIAAVTAAFGILASLFYATASSSDAESPLLGFVLMVIGLLLVLRYLLFQKTTIRIVANGQSRDIVGIFTPGKFKKFRALLIDSIRQAQAQSATNDNTPPSAAIIDPVISSDN